MASPDKNLVSSRFKKSLPTYSDNAFVQKKMASELLGQILALGRESYPKIFEIGCGSGLLTEMAAGALDYERYCLNDLVGECRALENKIHGGKFLEGDIENLSPLPSCMDLIISNAAFQWLSDLPTLLDRLAGTLAPGGALGFSTFGPGNAVEIARICGEALSYPSPEEIKRALNKNFDVLYFSEEAHKIRFENPLEVLRHLKLTGATGVRIERWTKKRLTEFCAGYEARFSEGGGVTLTYHPVIVVALLREQN